MLDASGDQVGKVRDVVLQNRPGKRAPRVKGLVDEVSEASRQQAQGIDQVSQAIAQMEKVTQTTAATAEESAAASEELNAQAFELQEVVQELGSMVDGTRVKVAVTSAVPVPQAPVTRKKTMTKSPSPKAAEGDFFRSEEMEAPTGKRFDA